jgi:hypothetical protein
MGGRKRRGSLTRPYVASDAFSGVVAVLEELFTATAEGSKPEAQSGAGKTVLEGGSQRSCSVVFLSSETVLEEPFGMAEGGIVMDLIRRPWTADDDGERTQMCTLIFLFRSSPGGAVHDVGAARKGFE